MRKIASPQELRTELRQLIAYVSGPRPSRERIAAVLRSMADRTANDGPKAQYVAWAEDERGTMVAFAGPMPKAVAQKQAREWQSKDLDTTVMPVDKALRELKSAPGVWFDGLTPKYHKVLKDFRDGKRGSA